MSRACVFPPAPERRTRGRRGAAAGTVPRPPRVPRIPVIYPKRGELPPLRRAPLDVLAMDAHWIALGDDVETDGAL